MLLIVADEIALIVWLLTKPLTVNELGVTLVLPL